jgi:hypothetical protein
VLLTVHAKVQRDRLALAANIPFKSVLYCEVITVEKQLVKFDTFVHRDVLLNVYLTK